MHEYKESGITINQFMNKVRTKLNLPTGTKIAYAGRLDPMARGIVPILINDECKKMNLYTSQDKIYHVKVIVGIQTDSDDVLGIIQKNLSQGQNVQKIIEIYNNIFNVSNLTIEQRFHYFSTKEINKRRRKINEPTSHTVKLYNSTILSSGTLNKDEWVDTINKLIATIDETKNFRQKEIIEQWVINKTGGVIEYIELELNVSSGFFVRQYIRDLSNTLNIPLMCYDIHRISCNNIS